jgi:adenylosuccinate synthase
MATGIVGAQWGDEGKGIIIVLYGQDADIVVRAQGGDNAGHTLYTLEGKKRVVNIAPSGVIIPNVMNLIGHGCVTNLETLASNLDGIQGIDERLLISDGTHLILPYHLAIDRAREKAAGKRKIGTTCRGIGPSYGDKIARVGIRAGMLRNRDLLMSKLEVAVNRANKELESLDSVERFSAEKIVSEQNDLFNRFESCLADVPAYLIEHDKLGERILFEGAQATMLDIDLGTYPGVTSSNTTIAGLCTGSGAPISMIDKRVGVAKAYTTRVGAGGFPTQGMAWEDLTGSGYDDISDDAVRAVFAGDTSHPLYDLAASIKMRQSGIEYGATTGRPRACGWLDLPQMRLVANVNDLTHLALTKIDVLAGIGKVKVATNHVNPRTEEEFRTYPSDFSRLSGTKPIYEELPGWEPCRGVNKWSDLPRNAQKYVEFVEDKVGVPVEIIKTGPKQKDYLRKKTF